MVGPGAAGDRSAAAGEFGEVALDVCDAVFEVFDVGVVVQGFGPGLVVGVEPVAVVGEEPGQRGGGLVVAFGALAPWRVLVSRRCWGRKRFTWSEARGQRGVGGARSRGVS